MGLLDRFWKDEDPQLKLARMPLLELREKRIEINMQLQQAHHQINRLREEFDGVIEKGRATANKNEQRLLASDAKKVQQRIELHQRDFDGLKDALENMDNIILIREGVGDKATVVEEEMRKLLKLSPHEYKKALEAKARSYESSRLRMKESQETFAGYATTSQSEESDADILAMMNSGKEPTLEKAATKVEKPAAKEPTPAEPVKEKEAKPERLTEEST